MCSFKPYKGVYLNKTKHIKIALVKVSFKPYKGVYLNNPKKEVYIDVLAFQTL